MTRNGSKFDWRSIVAGAVVLGAAGLTLLGITQSVQTLQDRVDTLEEVTVNVEMLEQRVARLSRETEKIASIREDILQAICAANVRDHRDVRRCFRALP
jgi:DNA-binding Xre family transcriptional regulator